TPSVSPGRGGRVVTDTESHTSGRRRRSSLTTVLFPTPEGPDRTVRRFGWSLPAPDSTGTDSPIPGSRCARDGRWFVAAASRRGGSFYTSSTGTGSSPPCSDEPVHTVAARTVGAP